jgi:hypothetical protein
MGGDPRPALGIGQCLQRAMSGACRLSGPGALPAPGFPARGPSRHALSIARGDSSPGGSSLVTRRHPLGGRAELAALDEPGVAAATDALRGQQFDEQLVVLANGIARHRRRLARPTVGEPALRVSSAAGSSAASGSGEA